MKLFRYEGYKVVISEEAFALKVFRQIWNRDRSVNKDKAIMELGYIYFMIDPRSDYQYLVDEDERSKAIIEGEGLDNNWKPDKIVTEAMEFYSKFKPTAALLLEDTRATIDKIRAMLRNINFDALEEKDKITALKNAASTVSLIPKLVKDLVEAEKAVTKEIQEQGRARGQGDKTLMDDGILL